MANGSGGFTKTDGESVANKYKFSTPERFGVWEAFNGQCFWCAEPIPFKHVSIDHVIPEKYQDDDTALKRIREGYALPADFKINDFCNWVPAHQNCNSKKGGMLFAFSPAMIANLEYVQKRAAKARSTAEKIIADNKKAIILAKVESAAELGIVAQADVTELFKGIEPLPSPDNIPILMHLTPGWSVLRATGNLLFLTNGSTIGYTTVLENPDASWMCPFCLNYGPWNGIICLSCGQRSEPD